MKAVEAKEKPVHEFWQDMMIKLNGKRKSKEVIPEILHEVCSYFGFGCSFVYEQVNEGDFLLLHDYSVYRNVIKLPDEMTIDPSLMETIFRNYEKHRYVYLPRKDAHDNANEERLLKLFRARCLFLLPICIDSRMTAFIGLADRRSMDRKKSVDVMFMHSILKVISDYIRVTFAESEAEASMETMKSILDHTGVEVVVIDYHTSEILYVNEYARKNKREEDYLGKKCWEMMLDEHDRCSFCPKKELVDEAYRPLKPITYNVYRKTDHTHRRMISAAFYWVDGRLAQVISNIDITENIKNQKKIEYYSEYDVLTNLKNRHRLYLDLDDGLKALKESNREGAIVFGDLNGFKNVNDTYGHDTGDEILRMVGACFNEDEDTKGCTYRYAGDEFIILCFHHTHEQIQQMIERITKKFEEPWQVGKKQIVCTISMGVTMYPRDAKTTDDLLHKADMMMYERKRGRL